MMMLYKNVNFYIVSLVAVLVPYLSNPDFGKSNTVFTPEAPNAIIL